MTENKEAPRDYIFGELDQPENAAVWMKKRLSGVRHYSQKEPKAPKPGDAVILKVTTESGQTFDEIFVWFTTDEWQTTEKMSFEKTYLKWNSITWSYIQEWQVTLPPQAEGVMLRYKIGAMTDNSEILTYTDNQAHTFDEATHYSLWFGGSCSPDWAKKAVVYQIFVDRFNHGAEKGWKQTSDVCQPFGGTLAGVIEKLPYLKDMGFNAIWLTPIFASPSHHGYDTSDYFQIKPEFGTLQEFKNMVSEAHRLGIRIILDFVANHCSNEHPYFQDALKNENSSYHDWFVWKKWPAYDSFFDVGTMPKIDLVYGSPARDQLLSAAKYWLELGVDGYRLDYAYGPEHDFWVDFRRTCLAVNPEVWTFGELVLPADIQASYADSLGGSLDFMLCQALRSTFGTQTWKLEKLAGFLGSHYRYFPEGHSLPSFIDNHDMDRFYTIAKDDLQRLRLALLVLYVLPGPPIIYYGTEMPLSQNHLLHEGGGLGFDEARLEMDWAAENGFELVQYLRKLADIRSQESFYAIEAWKELMLEEDEGILVLAANQTKSLLVINRSTLPKAVDIPVP
ncbi:MAG: hypothetical protein H0S79_20275, partial [Anaerolineaceae bacterium]|nr:hypothetical protein [Anaerolineaceae bacterium]